MMRHVHTIKHLAMGLSLGGALAQARNPVTFGVDGCRSGESWTLSDKIGADWASDFKDFLGGSNGALRGFADGMAFRRISREPEEKALAEYWVSHALDKMGLTHLAFAGYAALAGRTPTSDIRGIQTAALSCLNHIQEKYPTMEIPESVVKQYALYESSEPLHQAAASELRKRIATARPKADLDALMKLLENGGPYEALARAMLSAHLGDHNATVKVTRDYLAQTRTPAALDRYNDSVRVLLGRALYSRGEYSPALEEFKLVKKNSNELAHALSDLAWSQLRDEKYTEAIGTVVNLQSGGLRRTFAPEAPMVMAMSLNELCHYPESLQAVQYFRTAYETSHDWLQNWKDKESQAALYPKALAFLKKNKETPEKVASEWIRSPHFISRQDEIDLFFQTKQSIQRTKAEAALDQRKLAADILATLKDVKPRYDSAKANLREGEALPAKVQFELDHLRRLITEYRRLKRAANPWVAMTHNHEQRAVSQKATLVSGIEKELAALNLRMLMQLDEIAENMHFIEVEIFQGATQDIIWQNAHPDYKELVMTFKKDDQRDAQKSWNWGMVRGGLNGDHEIWEDELGSFKADLVDNCSSKDKYLSIKSKKHQAMN